MEKDCRGSLQLSRYLGEACEVFVEFERNVRQSVRRRVADEILDCCRAADNSCVYPVT